MVARLGAWRAQSCGRPLCALRGLCALCVNSRLPVFQGGRRSSGDGNGWARPRPEAHSPGRRVRASLRSDGPRAMAIAPIGAAVSSGGKRHQLVELGVLALRVVVCFRGDELRGLDFLVGIHDFRSSSVRFEGAPLPGPPHHAGSREGNGFDCDYFFCGVATRRAWAPAASPGRRGAPSGRLAQPARGPAASGWASERRERRSPARSE